MIEIWNQLLLYPLINSLIFLHQLTGGLGWAIILLTLGLRLAMTPLVLPSLRLTKKMQELAPELSRLKEQHKDDKTALMKAQAELYQKAGANPAAGCLPQILQLVILIALFNSLNLLLGNSGNDLVSRLDPILYSFNRVPSDFHLATSFLNINLVQPDTLRLAGLPFPLPGLLLLLSALGQFLSAKMMSPIVQAEKKIAGKTEGSTDDAMVAVQAQMLYLLPLMTIIFGFQFPAGLVLYWLVFSAISMIQQYFVTGWGGLTPYLKVVRLIK